MIELHTRTYSEKKDPKSSGKGVPITRSIRDSREGRGFELPHYVLYLIETIRPSHLQKETLYEDGMTNCGDYSRQTPTLIRIVLILLLSTPSSL